MSQSASEKKITQEEKFGNLHWYCLLLGGIPPPPEKCLKGSKKISNLLVVYGNLYVN
jgi:hypothetical protein